MYQETISAHRFGAIVTAVLIVAGCGAATGPVRQNNSLCQAAFGEFPPTDCAIVEGRAVDLEGRPIGSIGLRVDSVSRGGYEYLSGPGTTDPNGHFTLAVFRANRLHPPTVPDTATITIRAYRVTTPGPQDAPIASAPVVMHFAPFGQIPDRTSATIVFSIPR